MDSTNQSFRSMACVLTWAAWLCAATLAGTIVQGFWQQDPRAIVAILVPIGGTITFGIMLRSEKREWAAWRKRTGRAPLSASNTN